MEELQIERVKSVGMIVISVFIVHCYMSSCYRG
jgi:hypothetical protein